MDTITDFEDMLALLEKHGARYLVIGGLAVIYHAKPRYTKDMDLWVDPAAENIRKVNAALAEFGSPELLDEGHPEQILQIGVAPDRIDLLQTVTGVEFEEAYRTHVRGHYGRVEVKWIGLEALIRIKRRLEGPRHEEDLRLLLYVRNRRARPAEE